jgi:CubicO group peptidase (beta-lactamase class C family)
MILVERGKIDVHAPSPSTSRVREQRQGEGHRRAAPAAPRRPRRGQQLKDYTDDPAESMAKILDLPLKYEPGTDFIYSDMCYATLGELVHVVSGKPLNVFAQEEVFKPLGMKDTTYLPPKDWSPRIAPTEKSGGAFLRGTVHDPRAQKLGGFAGHAGVFSTADDVSRYCRMLLHRGELDGKRILKRSMIDEMTTSRCMPNGKNLPNVWLRQQQRILLLPRRPLRCGNDVRPYRLHRHHVLGRSAEQLLLHPARQQRAPQRQGKRQSAAKGCGDGCGRSLVGPGAGDEYCC